MYKYTESGLSNIFLKDGYEKFFDNNEEFISFIDLEKTHRAISLALCMKPARLNNAEVCFIRKEMNLSQSEFDSLLLLEDGATYQIETGLLKQNYRSDFLMRHLLAKHHNEAFSSHEYCSLIEGGVLRENIVISNFTYTWT
ncbi:hypothetical protein D051_0742 [Vibrio parahaemolyticus VPCR-2010]|nr:hypothetical protein D051_0742 [Vibrio parahaemolyticus VPCR-2010]